MRKEKIVIVIDSGIVNYFFFEESKFAWRIQFQIEEHLFFLGYYEANKWME